MRRPPKREVAPESEKEDRSLRLLLPHWEPEQLDSDNWFLVFLNGLRIPLTDSETDKNKRRQKEDE